MNYYLRNLNPGLKQEINNLINYQFLKKMNCFT